MKNYLIAGLFIFLFVLSPFFVNAQSTNDLVSQINSLLETIKSLQAQLAVLQKNQGQSPSGGGVPAGISSGVNLSNSCVAFQNNLYLGLRDKETDGEVSKLQQFLKEKGDYVYPLVTGYFGPATEQAVKRFQVRTGIISSGRAETTGYGVVGPQTMRIISELTCKTSFAVPNNPVTPTIQPSITVLSPVNGEQITSLSPIISGTANGMSQVGVVISFSKGGDKAYGSGNIPVVNGRWSVQVFPVLTPNEYTIHVYDTNNTQLATSYFKVVSSSVQSSISVSSNILYTDANGTKIEILLSAPQSSGITGWGISLDCPTGVTAWMKVSGGCGETQSTSNGTNSLRTEATISNPTAFNAVVGINVSGYDGRVTNYSPDWPLIASSRTTVTVPPNKVTQPSVTVLSPNGGETITLSNNNSVNFTTKWTGLNLKGDVTIYLSSVDGSACEIGVVGVDAREYSKSLGTNYICPNTGVKLIEGNYKVALFLNNHIAEIGDKMADFSDSYFKIISPLNNFSFTAPNSNIQSGQSVETKLNSSVQTVQWAVNIICPAGVTSKLLSSVYNGIDGCGKDVNVSGVSPVFPVQFTNTTNASQIVYMTARAYDTSILPVKSLTNDIPLKIVVAGSTQKPSISVDTPTSNQVWSTGMQKTITWTSSNYTGPIVAALFKGSNGVVIPSTPNTGLRFWTLPSDFVAGNDYYIQIGALDSNSNILKDSDGNSLIWKSSNFTIINP